MFVKSEQKNFIEAMKGVRRKTLACGEKSLMMQFVFEEGAVLPSHSHPHEQIGMLISGAMILSLAGKDISVQAGDSWAIPGGAEHAVRVTKPAVVVEVFVPIREDYLD